jgi:DNA-binding GntR family transcriptional regulator
MAASPSTPPLATIGRTGLVSQVYERLKSEIFEFRLAPGERYSESELATRVGASRTPLRIALHMLVRDGYMLKIDGHNGWMIRPLEFSYFEDLYDLRTNLEVIAIRRICESDPFPDLSELRRAWLVPEKQRTYDDVELSRLDEAFHSTLVSAAGNREMSRVHSDLQERIRIIRRLDFTVRERIDEAYLQHGKILRAVLARKEPQATLLMRSHIDSSRAEIRHITLHRLALARERSRIPIKEA